MLKFGIYNLKQLSNQNLDGFWGKKKYIAVDLFAETSLSGLFNKQLLEEAIMRRFTLANGSYRRTHGYRFEEFDADTLRQIKKFFSPDDLLRIHDVAVSDGRTACDFFQKIKRTFKKISYHATDKDTFVRIIRSRRNPKNRIVKDEEGNILQIIWPPFVFNIPKKENLVLYPINRFVLFLLLKNPQRLVKWLGLENTKEEKINIFSHRAERLQREEPSFSLGAYDLANKMPAKYDIIRAMNVINKSYFTENEAAIIINNLKEGLKDPGILLVGSNKNAGSPVDGNIFLKKKGRINILSQSGNGAPYKELFLAPQNHKEKDEPSVN